MCKMCWLRECMYMTWYFLIKYGYVLKMFMINVNKIIKSRPIFSSSSLIFLFTIFIIPDII